MKKPIPNSNTFQRKIDPAELSYRGHRNLEDAFFVRGIFIPSALKSQKWNIAVYEAYRVVELAIKGIMCLAGISPILENQSKYTHSIRKLLNLFEAELRKTEGHVSYFLALKSPSGNHYGIELIGNEAYLYKFIQNTWTQMQSSIDISSMSVGGLVNLRLKYENNTLILYHKDEVLTRQTDSSLISENLKFEMEFQRAPDDERIKKIIEIGELLLQNRTMAFYSEKTYSEEDARIATINMDDALEASKAFFASYQMQ